MKSTRNVKTPKKLAVKNMPQPVCYQKITESVAATGRFKPIHYVLMAFSVLLLSQLIKTVVYWIFFPGETSPDGLLLLLMIYLQYALFVAFFVLLVVALIQALRRAIKDL